MNCYLWGGSEWGASICRDYYNMHIRPLEAELLDLGVCRARRAAFQRPWLKDSDPARCLGFLEWVRSGELASCFPAPSGLDGLRYLRRRKGSKSSFGDRVWRDLSAEEFRTELRKPRACVTCRVDRACPCIAWKTLMVLNLPMRSVRLLLMQVTSASRSGRRFWPVFRSA
jgi:hypothetical protein